MPKRQRTGTDCVLVSLGKEAEDLEAGQGPQERIQVMA